MFRKFVDIKPQVVSSVPAQIMGRVVFCGAKANLVHTPKGLAILSVQGARTVLAATSVDVNNSTSTLVSVELKGERLFLDLNRALSLVA